MAYVVIAGVKLHHQKEQKARSHASSPEFAKVEFLADKLHRELPNFQVLKLMTLEQDWPKTAEELCRSNGWLSASRKSPIVWRELCGFGGKRLLIGGAAEFQEYAVGYYGQLADINSCTAVKHAIHNRDNKQRELREESSWLSAARRPVKLCISGANSPICYSFLSSALSGYILDSDVILYLLESAEFQGKLEGLVMEIIDCASPHLISVDFGSKIADGFGSADVIVIMDEEIMNTGESYDEFVLRYWHKYSNYGQVISAVANPDVKVILAVKFHSFGLGESYVPDIIIRAIDKPHMRRNVVCVPRTVQHNVKSELAAALQTHSSDIRDTVILGSRPEPGRCIIVYSLSTAVGSTKWSIVAPDGSEFTRKVTDMNFDPKTTYKMTAQRWSTIESMISHAAALSSSSASASLLRDWVLTSDRITSLGVCSQGWYGIPEGLMFYVPVKFNVPGQWKIVDHIPLNIHERAALRNIVLHAIKERKLMRDSVRQLLESSWIAKTAVRPIAPDDGDHDGRVTVSDHYVWIEQYDQHMYSKHRKQIELLQDD